MIIGLILFLFFGNLILASVVLVHNKHIAKAIGTQDFLVTKIDSIEKEIGNIYLTEDDRKTLGLPARMIMEVEAKEKLPCSGDHKWSGEHIGAPNNTAMNSKHMWKENDGKKAVIKKCLKCGAQRVRGEKIYGNFEWLLD